MPRYYWGAPFTHMQPCIIFPLPIVYCLFSRKLNPSLLDNVDSIG